MEKLDELIEVASEAIRDVFSDSSVEPEDTLLALIELKEQIENFISMVQNDISKKGD